MSGFLAPPAAAERATTSARRDDDGAAVFLLWFWFGFWVAYWLVGLGCWCLKRGEFELVREVVVIEKQKQQAAVLFLSRPAGRGGRRERARAMLWRAARARRAATPRAGADRAVGRPRLSGPERWRSRAAARSETDDPAPVAQFRQLGETEQALAVRERRKGVWEERFFAPALSLFNHVALSLPLFLSPRRQCARALEERSTMAPV
jgi:hypothetical protein